jgi:predicted ATP-dependent endonuclease of OLD family
MQKPTQNFRIDKISIRNYKGIDSLELEFPRPKFPNDPDIFVIGSRNGLGKTSVLECCALGLMELGHNLIDELYGSVGGAYVGTIDSNQSFVKLGSPHAEINLSLSSKDNQHSGKFKFELRQEKPGAFNLDYICENSQKENNEVSWIWGNNPDVKEKYRSFGYGFSFHRILNRNTSNPCVEKFFHFFPDNRATPHGKVPFEEIQGKQQVYHIPTNVFKIVSIQTILGMAGLWRKQEINQFHETFDELNKLTFEFANLEISRQFEKTGDLSMDLEVQFPSKEEDVFSFDGLSSGQKEMITTLFLIWENTRNASKVILIDEPEQHLNAEWHRYLIHKLYEIAPWNQYIIATHSKHIASAVDDEHQIMLAKSEE